jgi:hypothetical protein
LSTIPLNSVDACTPTSSTADDLVESNLDTIAETVGKDRRFALTFDAETPSISANAGRGPLALAVPGVTSCLVNR